MKFYPKDNRTTAAIVICKLKSLMHFSMLSHGGLEVTGQICLPFPTLGHLNVKFININPFTPKFPWKILHFKSHKGHFHAKFLNLHHFYGAAIISCNKVYATQIKPLPALFETRIVKNYLI